MRICIVAPDASAKFGGEAILPLHYFQKLRARNVDVWLVLHSRTREELTQVLGEDISRAYFVEDNWLDVLLYKCSKMLPNRIGLATFGLLLKFHTQYRQKKIIKRLVKEKAIQLVHEPAPVSPKSPSMIYGMGVPVVIGPMNGGMTYPAPFRFMQGKAESKFIHLARNASILFNRLIPGKNRAHTLLVANERTRQALPVDLTRSNVIELVENGVDLDVFDAAVSSPNEPHSGVTQLLFMGRLVDWKGVNYLLEVLGELKELPFHMDILGDGDKRWELENQARSLGLMDKITFHGFLTQRECADYLRRADALVLPSLYECGGAVVLEAMAMKKAVIATAWGGPADYLNDRCGLLISPDESVDAYKDGFKSAIKKLIENPEMAPKMGEVGYQRVLDEFNWSTKIDRILDIYTNAIEGTKS